MELDLTPFLPLLKQLGPWGWVAAAAIWFIQQRRGKPANPALPNAPLDPLGPLLPNLDPVDDVVNKLRERLKNRFPNLPIQSFAGEISPANHPSVLVAQRAELERQIERRREELAAQIQALGSKV